MLKLVLLNFIIIALIVVSLIILKNCIKSERSVRILFIVASLLTIVCHYSSLVYHGIKDNTAMTFLESNPNLILPIYPCNVVMWCCLIFAFNKKKNKFHDFLIDYIFLFGVISALVGLFANVDFIRNPSLKDYDVTKGILAHGFMLFNVLLFPTFGYFKIDLNKNIPNIIISIIMMLIVGLYCNLVFRVLSGESTAYNVNSMFLIHSPFDDSKLLTYPAIASIALILYFIVLFILELFLYDKDNRWFNRIKDLKSSQNNK